MGNWHQQVSALRVRIAYILRRIPWLISFLQRIYRVFRPKFSAGAIGILFNDLGQVLLVEHVFHPRHPWGAPGGWVDANESLTDTVAREMLEEVGLRVEVGELVHVEFLPSMRHMTFAFLCRADSHKVEHLSPELIGYGWHDPNHLPNVYPYLREALQKALARDDSSPVTFQD